jgi:hypothetical protein
VRLQCRGGGAGRRWRGVRGRGRGIVMGGSRWPTCGGLIFSWCLDVFCFGAAAESEGVTEII